jgi:hypothetical protein
VIELGKGLCRTVIWRFNIAYRHCLVRRWFIETRNEIGILDYCEIAHIAGSTGSARILKNEA